LINKKEPIVFIKKIPPGVTDVLSERVKGDGTIEGFTVRFFPGQENSLRVRPFVEHRGGTIEELVTYVETGDRFLSGDNDYDEYAAAIPVRNDDYVKVHVTNTSPYEYTLKIVVNVDYLGGQNRMM
jgi:hypothetical protein